MRYLLLILICMSAGAPSYALGGIVSNLEKEYQLSSPLQPVDEVRLADNSETDNSEDDDETEQNRFKYVLFEKVLKAYIGD